MANKELEKAQSQLAVNEVTDNILRCLGRPSQYTPDSCLSVIEAAAKGAHTAGMILAAGAKSRTTYYEWQKEYPDFKEACDLAKIISQAYYEHPEVIKSLPSTSWAIIVNNKFSEDYSRTGQTTGTTNNTNINFNTLNLSQTEKLNRIRGLLEKINTAGQEAGEVYDANPE